MPARDRRDAFDVSVINTRGNLIEPVVARRSRLPIASARELSKNNTSKGQPPPREGATS